MSLLDPSISVILLIIYVNKDVLNFNENRHEFYRLLNYIWLLGQTIFVRARQSCPVYLLATVMSLLLMSEKTLPMSQLPGKIISHMPEIRQ